MERIEGAVTVPSAIKNPAVEEETLELAHAIAANSPATVQVAKELLHDYVGMRLAHTPKLEEETRRTRTVAPPATESFKDFLNTRTS